MSKSECIRHLHRLLDAKEGLIETLRSERDNLKGQLEGYKEAQKRSQDTIVRILRK